MEPAAPSISHEALNALNALAARGLSRLAEDSALAAGLLADPGLAARVGRVAIASDFALETLRRQPALLESLARDDGAGPRVPPVLDADSPAHWPAQLRRHRMAESTRLVWRDVLGLDGVDAILDGSTRLAEDCLRIALAALEEDFARRHGVVRAADGSVQRLVVFGLGKLGGGELNFSSDID
ncbi:MAG: glutamine-synthetase adenylyltransferase, partial [Lysobacteraceae bacterium]